MHLRCLNIVHKDKHTKHQAMVSTYRVFYTLEPMPREGKEEGRKEGTKKEPRQKQTETTQRNTNRETQKDITNERRT